jgi:cytochrome c oxidase subunit 2
LGPAFHPQSPQAAAIAALFSGVLILAALIFAIVAGLVIYAILRYRARSGAGTPAQTFGSRRLEMIWTAIPLLIVCVLFVLTARTMASVEAPQNGLRQPDIVIIGRQWWWEARYPNGVMAAHEIHIPLGRRLLARVESPDVIHDFWAPELARKVDAVPGTPGYIWLEADRPGTYLGACAEFCGVQHAGHRFQVIAEPEAQFQKWLAAQAENAPAAPASFTANKCADCHSVAGIETRVMKGPTLAHIASRATLGGGALPNTPANLARWVDTPQAVKPGVRMPDSHLTAADAAEITAYLGGLK